MEKEALINIILNDLKEVHSLVNTFKGKSEINTAFINLTRTKIANINEELNLLEQLNCENPSVAQSYSIETAEAIEPIREVKTEALEKTPEPIIKKETKQEAPIQTKEAPVINEEPKTPEVIISEPKAEVSPEPKAEKVTVATVTEPTSMPKEAEAKQSVIGETINKDASSLNETMASKNEQSEGFKQIGKPVDDVKKAFGLNDRFFFQRELFNNNADLFNQTLDQINTMESFELAANFLQSNYNWGSDNEAGEAFLKNVKRRFI